MLHEGLRYDAGAGEYGHEVGVARPARDDVLVDAVLQPGSGGLAEVVAEEKKTNPFLRVGSLLEFADLRCRKDRF